MSTHDIIRQTVKLSQEQGIFKHIMTSMTFDFWPYDPKI